METEIRELMRERADEVRVPPELPGPTLRRARRRRLANGAVAGVTAAVVVVGAVIGVQAAFHESGGRTPIGNGTAEPTPQTSATAPVAVRTTPFPGIWPERNADELQAEQAKVDQGADRYRLDPKQSAIEFAHQALGWDTTVVDAKVQVDPGTSTSSGLSIELQYGTLTREEGLQPKAPYALHVETKQLGRTGAGGIWSVVGVSSDLLTVKCDLGATGAEDGLGGPPLQVGGTVRVCGTTSWDASLARVQAWVVPGDAATTGLARDEASPFARIAVQPDGSFDGNVSPIPSGYGSSGVFVVEVLDQGGDPAGVLARKVEISAPPAPGESPEGPAGLTDAAARTRAAIIAAAGASNYGALADLIDPDQFQFTFGGVSPGTSVADQAITYWKEQGPEPLRIMGALLDMPYTTERAEGGDIYVWPAIVTWSPDQLARIGESEWPSALGQIYPDFDRQLQSWIQSGGYLGWRIGITEDGRWIYFLAGD